MYVLFIGLVIVARVMSFQVAMLVVSVTEMLLCICQCGHDIITAAHAILAANILVQTFSLYVFLCMMQWRDSQ